MFLGSFCDPNAMPGGEGTMRHATHVENGMSVMLSCPYAHILSSMKFFQMVHCKHGEWNMKTIPDCVGKDTFVLIDCFFVANLS